MHHHVTKIQSPYIDLISLENPNDFFNVVKNKSNIRITLDVPEDLMLIRNIVSKISNRPILYKDLMELFEREPEILAINKNIKHDGYERSLRED